MEILSAPEPASCPGHVQLFARAAPSARELPFRLAELGVVHRDEPGGALHGLFRLRQFTCDEGHVFCAEDQVRDEVARFCRALSAFYDAFGLPAPAVTLSLRPGGRVGDDATWDRAEALLADAARAAGLAPAPHPGAGSFHGPRLEFALPDASGHPWRCGSVLLDLALPERLGLGYAAGEGERRRPAMLHRAVYGSLERFLALVLERHAGRLPPWLAPVQVRVLPESSDVGGYVEEVVAELARAGLRCDADVRPGTLARRVAMAHEEAVPAVWVVGERERRARTVAVRDASGVRSSGLGTAVRGLSAAVAAPV